MLIPGWSRFTADLHKVREVLILLWSQASRFVRVRLITVLTLVIVTALLTALGPVALKLMVDGFIGQAKGVAISPILIVGLYVLSQGLARTVGTIHGFIYARAEQRMSRTVSERLFGHLMQLPLRFHLERQTGAVSQTLNNGLRGYQLVFRHIVFSLLPAAAELGTILLVLTRLHYPMLLAIFCGAVICYGMAFVHAASRTSKTARRSSRAHIDANAAITDGILNYETVKYFAAESIVQQQVGNALAHAEAEAVKFYRGYAANRLGAATIFAGFLAAATVCAFSAVRSGRMTVGDFVLVNTYMLQVVRPIEMLGLAMQGLSEGIAMLQDMLALLREVPEDPSKDAGICCAGPGSLEFEQVVLSYGPGRAVINEVSFKIPPGKTLGLVGVSGSGKSTIVRLLARLFEPDSGRVLIDGIRISEFSLPTLRRSMAVVPQDSVLFNASIGYNIAFGKANSTRDEVEQAARAAELHDFVMTLPDKYDTRVGERGVKLSGGEKQRVSIARAVIKRPRIYVFDEATSSLDSDTEQQIIRNLQEISRGSTTLVIAHRLSTVVHADEIVVLEDGRIIERGTHTSLLSHKGRYAALWLAQLDRSTGNP
jgi:ABC-type transport system involved in Fe-S cluster assembly fused permease/ATPase subunit